MSYKIINISGGDLHFQGLRYVTGGSEQVAKLDPRHRKLEEKKLVSIMNMMDDLNEQEFMPAGEDPPTEELAPEVTSTSGGTDAELNTQQAPAVDSAGAGSAGGDSVPAAPVAEESAPAPAPTPAPAPEPVPAPKPQQHNHTGKPNR